MIRSSRLMAVLLLISGALAVGCDNKTDAAPATGEEKKEASPKKGRVGSCDVKKTDGYCRQFGEANFDAAGEEHLKSMCHGTFSLKPCPTTNAVGKCAIPEGDKIFYSDGPIPTTAASGEKQCKEGIPAGKWKAL